MRLTVLIPARNEQETILEILKRVNGQLAHGQDEVIVIDDGSDDGTAELARTIPGVRLIALRPGRGKGAALRLGLQEARGDYVLIQDADLEYDPTDYPRLLAPLLAGKADVVYGSRILGARQGRRIGVSSWSFYWGGRLLSWLTSGLYGVRISDVSTGYKVFRTSRLREVGWQANGFEFCPEITARLLRRGISIFEVPIAYAPRTFAEGKKIRWTDGLTAVWVLLRLRWNQTSPIP